MEGEPVYVRVLYHFDYTTKETRLISIRQGEKLELLKQTNEDWWQVRRDIDAKPFYVPAAYVREIPPPFINPLIHPPPALKNVKYNGKISKVIKNDFVTKISPLTEYKNIDDIKSAPPNARKYIEAALRTELIHGNYKCKSPYENHNIIKKCNDQLQDNTLYQSQLGNLVRDIRVQKNKVSVDNRGITSVSFQPSSVESRGYSLVHSSSIPPKKPVPCPRKELSKSLETLAEEIQFTPSQNSDSSWRANGETSDYHTPSPDCLDSDMFWKKAQETPATSIQRSSSLRVTRWPSRKKKRERKRAALQSGDSESGGDESFVDSGAEACSSSSYEWDRSGDDVTPHRIPALAFRNYTYRSTDDSDSEVEKPRPRSSSDTTLPHRLNLGEFDEPQETISGLGDDCESSKSESQNSVPKPLVALKRNQKMVGCRRRPALLCIPSNNSNASNNNKVIKDVYLPRAPRTPPAPAPHEKPLRVLPGGWAEFYCSDAGGTGRVFYLNAVTGARSWKPPRARKPYDEGSVGSSLENTRSRSTSPADSSSSLVLPPGWEEQYDEEAEQTCFVHVATGAKTADVPGSVVRWLSDLRRDTDSSDIDEELRLRVACEAVASEVELVPSSPEYDATSCQDNTHQVDTSQTQDTTVGDTKGEKIWNHNPVFKSITNEEQKPITKCYKESSFKLLCKEARKASKSLITATSSVEDDADFKSTKSSNSVNDDIDFETLSERALSIADEALAECTKMGARTRRGSDISDDVFCSTSSAPTGSTVSVKDIFDNGGSVTPPVAPPRRKKRTNSSENKQSPSVEIFQQIKDFTSNTLIEDNNNKASTKSLTFNNNNSPSKRTSNIVHNEKSSKVVKDSIESEKTDVCKEKQCKNEKIKTRSAGDNKIEEKSKDTKLIKPVFAQQFSLQVVDRCTYYPNIQRSTSVPQVSQQLKALYVDEAKLLDNEKQSGKDKISKIPKNENSSKPLVELKIIETVSVSNNNNNIKLLVNKETCDNFEALLSESSETSMICEPPSCSYSGDQTCDSLNTNLEEQPSLTYLDVSLEQAAAEESMRSRKGSFSSDVIAWKQELLHQWDKLEDEEDSYNARPEPEEWFSSSDREGRLYFFEENSNASSWTLPENVRPSTPSSPAEKTTSNVNSNINSNTNRQTSAVAAAVAACAARQGMVERRGANELAARKTIAALTPTHNSDDDDQSVDDSVIRARLPPGALPLPNIARGSKARSMLVDAKRGPVSEETAVKCASIPRNWPQFGEAGMTVLKEGLLQKTRITENGKKLRKNWATSHVVLTELLLLFFRDAKSFAAMKSGNAGNSKPEMCVDLNGASVESADKLSSRKNVFVVTTALGQQVLCQEENVSAADSWFYQLSLAIKNLEKPTGGYGTATRIKILPSREPSPQPEPQQPSPEEKRAASSISRSKSVKIKKDLGSVEDLSASPTEQTKIKARLKKFFVRRPTMESLVKKGIWKDEPAFGSTLSKQCTDDSMQVPIFVQRCIAAIEGKLENMKTDGLYRASGNLSQVQKIRLQVDQNNMGVLEQEEDVHVLTGTLKLFFRELKEPLIPYDAFHKALKASTNSNKKEKLQQLRDIVRHLPGPNYDTLHYLLQHLLRVTEHQASNRMHIPNLAIVFGPTLMWPEQESLNMALDLMQQNIVIESLLQDFDTIFR